VWTITVLDLVLRTKDFTLLNRRYRSHPRARSEELVLSVVVNHVARPEC
jgi:hypothetical protein